MSSSRPFQKSKTPDQKSVMDGILRLTEAADVSMLAKAVGQSCDDRIGWTAENLGRGCLKFGNECCSLYLFLCPLASWTIDW